MRKNAAMFIPVIAVFAAAVACSDATMPGTSAGMMPDTLLSRGPIDTLYAAPRMPDTVTVAAMPVDTLF